MASKAYVSEIKRFLKYKFVDDVDYTDNTYLLQITDVDVVKYLNLRAFGKENPSEGDLPTYGRANTLKCIKKKLSFFMPRKNVVWDEITKQGNPTRSIAVNKVLAVVTKYEVRRQGVASQARREIEYDEFLQLMELIKIEPTLNEKEKYRIGSILSLQWHMIARIDDMMKLQLRNIFSSRQFADVLLIQMRWSKNITEEREAPQQFILGSMEERICPLLNLAVHSEMMGCNVAEGEQERGDSFLFGNGNDGHRRVRAVLEIIFGMYAI